MSDLRGMFCLVFFAAAVMVAAEEDFKMGSSEVKIAAESGMMEFRHHRRTMTNRTIEGRPVQIRMAQVVQLDKDGNKVTNCTADEPPTNRRKRRSSGKGSTSQQGSGSASGGMGGNSGSGSGSMGNGGQHASGSGNSGNGQKGPGSSNEGMGGDHSSQRESGSWTRPHRSWVGQNGTGVGKRFSNFEHTTFTVEKKVKMTLRHGGSLKAATKRFHANLGDDVGKMAIDMALPEGDGEIDINGEKQKLKKGDLKFNIELSEWTWCGEDGEDGAAAFLDVYVEVNSTQLPKKRHSRTSSSPASFDLGDNTTMSFSGKFQRDDDWVNVVDGYPKVDSEDSSLIIVRFTRFNNSMLYDPTVSVEDEGEDDGEDDGEATGSNGASSGSLSAIFVAMATAVTYAVLK